MQNNVGSSSKNDADSSGNFESRNKSTESTQKDSETKRERKSRWGDDNEGENITDVPQPTQNLESTSNDIQPPTIENESGFEQSGDGSSEIASENRTRKGYGSRRKPVGEEGREGHGGHGKGVGGSVAGEVDGCTGGRGYMEQRVGEGTLED